MTITLELTAEQEREVLESARRHDEATLRRILMQALEVTIEELMRSSAEAEKDEFETLADRLAASFSASSGQGSLLLTREDTYGDHP